MNAVILVLETFRPGVRARPSSGLLGAVAVSAAASQILAPR